MDEFDLIAALLADEPPLPDWVRTGPGDDAAVLRPAAGSEWVMSTDTLVEGRHFPAGMPPDLLGWRALAVNLSDLAAMGAEPSGFLVALVAPALDERWCRGFSTGLRAAAGDSGARLVGGNLARGPLAVTVTVTGTVPAGTALLRSGARPGDALYVSGRIGAAVAALRQLEAGPEVLAGLTLATVPEALRAYLLPQARIGLGLRLRGRARACIDVSDGLLADLGHICEASAVGAEVDLEAVPIASGVAAETAVSGGDDYELLFTLPEAMDAEPLQESGVPLQCIGRMVVGEGVRLLDARGRDVAIGERGWSHFR